MSHTPPPFDIKAFRQALGCFATGVAIVTTRGSGGEPIGLTVNSFNSVSLDPPLVLWSLAKTSRHLPHFTANGHWAVHILAADQEALSNRFAKGGEDKFAGLPASTGAGGVPLLDGCAARLQCRMHAWHEGGDHLIFVGEVQHFERSERAPLVFHSGAYAWALRKPHDLGQDLGLPAVATDRDRLALQVRAEVLRLNSELLPQLPAEQAALLHKRLQVLAALTAPAD
ncbi:MAG TPA: flavin reductase family protein [Macromonas sp.]|nr:flavin reductase family protein [Macromonas sp.]